MLVTALIVALGCARPAFAEPIQPVTLNQPASRADWATKSVLLSIANAGRRLVAVGERGFVLLSDDDGRTWRQAASVPTSVTLTKVSFSSASEGWTVGHMGVVLHTTDAGDNWLKQLDGVEAGNLALNHAKEAAQHAAAVDAKKLQKQVKSAELLVRDGADKPFLSVVTLDGSKSFAFGAFGYAFATDNGGRSWMPIFDRIDASSDRHIYGVTVLNGALYAAGEQGLLLRSREDGRFEPMSSPYPGTLFGIIGVPGGALIAYGLRGTLLRSDDGGRQWIEVKSGVDLAITAAVVLADGRIVVGAQSGQLVASSDGGRMFGDLTVAPQPVAGLAQATDGSLIVVGPRGISRIEPQQIAGAK